MRLTDLQTRMLVLLTKPGATIIRHTGTGLYASVTITDGEKDRNLSRSTLNCFYRHRLIRQVRVDLVAPGARRVQRYIYSLSPRGLERAKGLAA